MRISWYSISISLKSGGGVIFNGYFSVDNNTNLVTAFYETINGSTNFNNNILIPPNQSFYGSPDNIYQSGWLQFSNDGCAISSMSFINNPPGNYQYNLCSFGNNPATTNIGAVVNNTSYEWFYSITNILPTSNPISNICFPAGTPITCNQGNIPIEKINPDIHTICNKKIVGITKTITQDKYLVCFEKDALGTNFPLQKTIISKNHRILYKGNMRQAKEFVGLNDKVYKIKYKKEVLYNVLMEEYDKMVVNNLICETLHPENGIAKIYRELQKLNPQEQDELIKKYNNYVIKNVKQFQMHFWR